jgi:hypothetical protein
MHDIRYVQHHMGQAEVGRSALGGSLPLAKTCPSGQAKAPLYVLHHPCDKC